MFQRLNILPTFRACCLVMTLSASTVLGACNAIGVPELVRLSPPDYLTKVLNTVCYQTSFKIMISTQSLLFFQQTFIHRSHRGNHLKSARAPPNMMALWICKIKSFYISCEEAPYLRKITKSSNKLCIRFARKSNLGKHIREKFHITSNPQSWLSALLPSLYLGVCR